MKTPYIMMLVLALSFVARADDPTPTPTETPAPTASPTEPPPIKCKKHWEVRTLEKTSMEGGGCEVLYGKKGVKKPIAQAKNELSKCDQVIEKMKVTLTSLGFKCE